MATLRVAAAKVGELQNGQMKEVEIGEAGKVLLIREGDKYSAVGNKCTHYGAPLKNGAYSAGRVRCPWHGACFNTTTGDIEDFPGLDGIHSFETEIAGDEVFVIADPEKVKNFKRGSSCPSGSSDEVFAIIGGGPCGLTCAAQLRQNGFTGQIVLISREADAPYDRVKLSKAMNLTADRIALRPPEFYTEMNIQLKLSTTVTEIKPAEKTLQFQDGGSLKYSKLLIASGAAPRTLPIPGKDLGNIFVLREVSDAQSIFKAYEGKKMVIIGSSFIGMEVAAFAAKNATSVVVVGMESVPFERVLGPQVGAALKQLHEQNGVKFLMGRTTKEYKGDSTGQVKSVVLDDGQELEAEIVVLGAGVIPATSFVPESITKFRDGSLIVDQYMQTSEQDIFAAGDLARFPLPMIGNEMTRIEHYGMAQYQGKVAALNMIKAKSAPFNSVPFFWTAIFGKSVRYCGHALRFDQVIFHQDPSDPLKFVAYYSDQGKVTAVCTLARDPIASASAELFQQNRMPSAEQLKDPQFDILSLLSN